LDIAPLASEYRFRPKVGTHLSAFEALAEVDPGFGRGAEGSSMASEAKFLMAQFLSWVEAKPRSLVEVRAAWSSTCPLNCAWEDALSDDLVECRADGTVVLSAHGRARLEHA
jgi:hypothetical protein